MNYPTFFDDVPSIRLVDPLSELLGAFEAGAITFDYVDVVRLAGHSCPTVAGAYLMTAKALERLYPDALPKRGDIKVMFKTSLEEGVTGVIANVISMITGATDKSGFKGLQGSFARHSLLSFDADIGLSVRFTRIDTHASVDLSYQPDSIVPDPRQMPLLKKVLSHQASDDEKRLFATLWQDRVKKILVDNFDNEDLLQIQSVL